MTLETLQIAKKLEAEINAVQLQLAHLNNLLDETKGNSVKARVQGTELELPKAAFTGEINKQKKNLETQLTDLESQFSAL